MELAIDVPQAELEALCHRYQIRRLMLFGSVLGDDFNPDSDVDVLVEFEPEARVGFFKFVDIQDALSAALGRSVDLHTPQSLSRHFRDNVLGAAATLYERA